MITEQQEIDIKKHYEIALNLINIGQMSKAKFELYNKMNRELYDESLDLLDNRNMKYKLKSGDLKSLIDEVHQLISDHKEECDNDLEDDNFNNFI